MNKIMKAILVLLVILLVIYLMIGFFIWYSAGKPTNKIIVIIWGKYAPHAFKTVIEDLRAP